MKMNHRDSNSRKGPNTTKQGSPKAKHSLKELAARTKAQPGQELNEGGKEPFEKAASVELNANMSCAEAFRIIAGNCIRQIVANETGMCEGHPEALHQLRIGLRRLRVAMKAFAAVTADTQQEETKADVRWVMKQIGPARDLDVFGADVLEQIGKIGMDDPQLAAAHRSYDEMRRQAHESARSSIRSDRFRKILLDLGEWINAGPWATDVALEEVREREVTKHAVEIMGEWRKDFRKLCRKLEDLSPKQRHRLRMRAKDLRYVTEFFVSLFPAHGKRRTATLAALEKLQDTLGALNDLIARKGIMPEEINQSTHARRILAAQEKNAGELLEEAKAACAKFCDVKAFWK
jgi:CHAD domain-containing protein